MRSSREIILLGIAILTPLSLVAGCGGGSNSLGTSESTQSEIGNRQSSYEFLRPKGGNNKIVTFGVEAPASERNAASMVLENALDARASGNFASQCALLSAATITEITDESKDGDATCPQVLKELAEPLKKTTKIRASTLHGPISALRVEGLKAYALYHGMNKTDFAMPMVQESGQWKVAALLEAELGPS